MAHTDTRPSFRLPWTTEPGAPAQPPEATPEPAQPADATTPEPAVADESTPAQEPVTPVIDATATAGVRRPTKFMAELGRAMQVAAETARDETLARLGADLKIVVEEIHAAATLEAADLRRRADDDVASVRDWSKAEVARIREETEARIALRKTALDGEVEAHTATIATRVDTVGATVAEFEARMTDFFERLRAEEDPTRIATMAETMPDPPDLGDVAALIVDTVVEAFDPRLAAIATAPAVEEVVPSESDQVVPSESDPVAPAPDFEAAEAEAEAAAFTGDVDDEDEVLAPAPVAFDEADPARLAATADDSPVPSERTTTRVVVTGLVSVASIATFKRSLGRVHGVSAIGVASGPDGEFIFMVSHGAGIGLGDAISGLPGFQAQVTAETPEGLQVTAHDPDTGA